MRLEESKKSRLIISAILLCLGLVIKFTSSENFYTDIAFFLAWLISGIDIIYQALLNLKSKMLLAEHFLMTVATVGAIFLGDLVEAAMVMVLFQLGEFLQDRAIDKSRESIFQLMDLAASVAYKIVDDKRIEVDPDELEIGDIVEVPAGGKIPVDGEIVSGAGYVDTSMLTGESMPLSVELGSKVLSGSINGSSKLLIKTEKTAENSTAMKIAKLVEEATENQAKTESFITKFAKIYTPIVVGMAILIAILVPLILGQGLSKDWLERGLIFLVVSCPCAFVVSVPMTFVMGIGRASKMGILVKGGNVFENIVFADCLALDKTGTITKGNFQITDIWTSEGDEDYAISLAATIERGSNHPIATAIMQKAAESQTTNSVSIDSIQVIDGRGMFAYKDGKNYLLGNDKLMEENDIPYENSDEDGTIIYLAEKGEENKLIAYFIIEDTIKETSKSAIENLNNLGIKKVLMLTGDNELAAKKVADSVAIREYKSGLLPQDKLQIIKNEKENLNSHIIFVGDGMNDAPVITLSDVGISMGAIGSDAAIEASDVVITNDDLMSIPKLIEFSRFVIKIAKENIWLSMGIKLIFLALTALGLTQMWMAVFADVGVTLLAIANCFRVFVYKEQT